ncbi:bifunctional folylpolyglutamate synthase/dihydrofolate synthase [Aquicoccus porphyridii]|uniref:Dihydrofolate synthase/folylpolyglutamate synthase n=1 Tax=Aquicoccus porphyridii TaxID=1852029 RepID=A0A5A9ZK83_9RHOB|nr:folylpolyglutamate synthase/dihydrofolate synthase family protein [Aquicoccus porphyridii]KAA0917631.1 bifunctional folylpolyglutamate synthase/dihydrofolate synthase [Aquicoccus porphyridii]RAI55705.1 bifunctional folylpolyglutamate synthase/dihydrofolate synthase [Rhodobacteraceae bacterium AsT-22]
MTARSDVILDRMMALHPKIIDLTLDRVWRLLDALGNPQSDLPPVIHIAGTNGKGSTLAMIRAGLEGAGKRAHAYTSPHLARFHERIRLAGELITEEHLTAVLDECDAANDGIPITYFEITTCAAILAMARTPADYTLLEVGLGGRLDSTNVIDRPALTVITPVSYDHPQFLGETLPEIAREKAGILKPGVTCVVSRQHPDAMAVIDARAEEIGAPLLVQGRDWDAWEERGRFVYQDLRGLIDLPPPALIGAHQFQNAGAAIMALRHLGLGDDAAEAALRDATWPARMQRLRSGPLLDMAPRAEFWLDGGHNAACGETLAETLTRLPMRDTHLVCGMMNTKDVAGYMAPLEPHAASLTAVSIPGETNTLPAADTARHAAASGIPASTAESVEEAVRIITARDATARILICGSLYLAGRVLRDHG